MHCIVCTAYNQSYCVKAKISGNYSYTGWVPRCKPYVGCTRRRCNGVVGTVRK